MYKIKVNNELNYDVEQAREELVINGEKITADVKNIGNTSLHVINNLKSYQVEVVAFNQEEKTAEIKVNNNTYMLTAKDQYDLLLDQLGLSALTIARISDIKAPMPGLVLKIFSAEGMEVKKGENLLVLEAMKMENIIKAQADVVVKTIKVKPGDKVEKGQILITF